MKRSKTAPMKWLLAILMLMSGISDQALAGRRPHAAKPKPSAADTFVFVSPDDLLQQVGLTRAHYNASNPSAEAQWRKAWAAKGTKGDDNVYQSIRKRSAAPKDKERAGR